MSTVTVAQYVVHTGDTTTASATVQANLDVAEGLVEEYLRRELASSERTEDIKVWPGAVVFPKHLPVTSVQASAQYEVKNSAVIEYVTADDVGVSVVTDYSSAVDEYPHSLPTASITYVGGWTSSTLPPSIIRVVSLAAKAFASPATITPSGITDASVGDISVKYSLTSSTSEVALDAIVPAASALIGAYRWRPA